MSTGDCLAEHLAGTDDVLVYLDEAYAAAQSSIDPGLLVACEHTICDILGATPDQTERPPSSLSNEAIDACTLFTEKYMLDVANLDDDSVETVRIHLGDQGLADFVAGLLVVEQRHRMALALRAVLGSNP